MSTTEAVTNLVQSFSAAINAQDAKALAAVFTEDAELITIFAGRQRGRAEIEAQHARQFSLALQGIRVTFVVTDVKELAPDVSLLHAEWKREVVAAAAGAASLPPGNGVFTFVSTRSDGGWLLASAHNTQYAVPPGK